LGVRFRRLVELIVDKYCPVLQMSVLGWEEEAAWRWRIRLWVWEKEMLGECITLLRTVSLQPNVTDSWWW